MDCRSIGGQANGEKWSSVMDPVLTTAIVVGSFLVEFALILFVGQKACDWWDRRKGRRQTS